MWTQLLALFNLLVSVTPISLPEDALDSHTYRSPVLAGPIGPDCVSGAKLSGRGTGKNVTIGGAPTYVAEPEGDEGGLKRVMLFYSDVFSPFYVNNVLLQDWFAMQGFHVLGIDYFFGDPIQNHENETGWDSLAWYRKSQVQADRAVPTWFEAVKEQYGNPSDAVKYVAVGYCFGAPYAMDSGASNDVVAVAFAQPASLVEEHFYNLTKPVLLSLAENDSTFSVESFHRAQEILFEKKASYHIQIFSNTTHGFATRADLEDENAAWAKNTSAKSVVEWFNRFISL